MSREGIERLFRGIWTFFAVLFVTLAVGFAVGWVVRAAVDKPSEQVTTVEDRVGAGLTPAPPTPPDMRVRIRRFAAHPGNGGTDR